MELGEKDLCDIQDELWDARSKWYNIGLGLLLAASDLDVIDKDKGDIDAKFRSMILKWLRGGEQCTWEVLCKALSARSVDQTILARTIRQKYCPAGGETTGQSLINAPTSISSQVSLSDYCAWVKSKSTSTLYPCTGEPPKVQAVPANTCNPTHVSAEDPSLVKPSHITLELRYSEETDVVCPPRECESPPVLIKECGKITMDTESRDPEEPTSTSPRRELSLKKNIKLREYQKELAEPGVSGKNYVLVAPTGTGKTLIAGYIIMHHLKQMWEEKRQGKVAFVTPTQQLTFQQKVRLQEYILGITAVEITGASGEPMYPLIQSDRVDVIVCTAGKLRRELKTKDVQITDFSLIIADECHHAGRSSNYTDVMEFYIRIKLATSSRLLPQVVGMTASPGAGRGKGELVRVMDHQISLCATLDATAGIVTITRNVDELKRFRNDPKMCLEVKDERNPEEPFNMHMHSAMGLLETHIGNVPSLARGSSKYESWLQNEKEAAESREENETTRISILDQLIVYSQSLMTYHDFRYEDAVAVLEDVNEFQHQSDLEMVLNAVHRNLVDSLNLLSKVPNPLLVHMESILLQQYAKYPDSKGVFFVRAIKHTRYVTDWIQSSPALSRVIRVAPITGHSPGGMQKSEQIRVLDGFRKGTYNLLASTSVLEEGLDVPECNYVIRYQNVSNEIAQVQAKGRARARDSRIYTVVSSHSNREYWYLVQEEKQHTVDIAITLLPFCTLEKDIQHKQRLLIEERDRKAQQMKELRSKWPHPENVEIRCKKCNVVACKGSDVFTYSISTADPHYVVPSKTFSDKYHKKDHDKPEISEDFVKPYKIYCRSQNCRNQWGIIGLWRDTGYKFPVLKSDQFLFKYNCNTQRFRRWKDIWFNVRSILDWTEFEDDVVEA